MADDTIFGTVPQRNEQDVYDDQYIEAAEQDRPFLEAQVDAMQSGTATQRRKAATVPFEQHRQRVQQRAQRQSPEMRQAELNTRIRTKLNQHQDLYGMTEDERKEVTLRIAAQEADSMGMVDMAQTFADQYVKHREGIIKRDLEMARLRANVQEDQNKARKSGENTNTYVDVDGNKYEQRENLDGKPLSEPKLKEYGKYYAVGDQVFTPSGQEIETNAQSEEKAKEIAAGIQKTGAEFVNIDDSLVKIEDAMKNLGGGTALGRWLTAGAAGEALSNVGALPFVGNDARLLKAQLDSIKSELAFGRLQQMRNQSTTGGALGAINTRELELLMASVASLDQGLSPPDLMRQLQKVAKHYKNWKELTMGQMGLDDIDWSDPNYSDFTSIGSQGETLVTIGRDVFVVE